VLDSAARISFHTRVFFPRVRLIRDSDAGLAAKGGEPSRKIIWGAMQRERTSGARGEREDRSSAGRDNGYVTMRRSNVSESLRDALEHKPPSTSACHCRTSERSMGLLQKIERLIEK